MTLELTKLSTGLNNCVVCSRTAKWLAVDRTNNRHSWFCESCLSDIKAVEVPTLDTTNQFMVSLKGGDIAILSPIRVFSKELAVNLAAWLVVMSDVSDDDFEALVVAIRNS